MSSPSVETRDLSACPLCDSSHLAEEPFEYLYEGVAFPGARCRRCGFVFLRRQPAGESFRRMYDAAYFESDYHCGHEERPYFAGEREESASADGLLVLLEREIDKGRLLEVGCAGGYFLAAARKRGWATTGIEISEDASRFARDHLGLDVHTGTLESVPLAPGSFDVVYLGDVLEHVPDPLPTLGRLHDLIRPGGLVAIGGPITLNSIDRRLGLWAMRLLGRRKVLRQAPYHLSEFVPGTLRFALCQAGFETLRMVQSKIPPTARNVRRRAPLEHWAKFLLDVPNAAITGWFGVAGDRALAIARRP